MRKYGAMLPLVLALAVGATGCYGPFNLTKKVHKWNGDVSDNKWVNEAAFLGLVILPVYVFATLGDAIIFNSIEFWGGKNPITAKTIKSLENGDQQAVMTYSAGERKLRIDLFEKGKVAGTLVFEPEGDRMVARDGKGRVLMSAQTQGDKVVLRDAKGKVRAERALSELRDESLAKR